MRREKILILCPYPHAGAPSQRFRFEQYISMLEENGFDVTQAPFLDTKTAKIVNQPGHLREKVLGVVGGFGRRFRLLTRGRDFDYVFIHLEAAPIGPPIVEAALLAMGRKLIYDIDDAIFISRTQSVNRLAAGLRWRSKVAWVAKHSYKVLGVNPFLVEWASQYNDHVELIPTTIDPKHHRPPPSPIDKPRTVLGWTGTRTTAPYLDVIREALSELDRTHDFGLRVVCDRDPGFRLKNYEYLPWRAATEIEDLWPMDIGLMPVPDEDFAKGKVGFKAIQYSAMEIPPVVSDVGSGPEVVEHGVTGLVVPNSTQAWVDALTRMLDDPASRKSMGARAREKILARYAIPAQAPRYLGLFR